MNKALIFVIGFVLGDFLGFLTAAILAAAGREDDDK